MDRRSDGDNFVGVHTLVRCLACKFAGDLYDFRHAGHAANEDELIDFRGGNTGFLEAIADGFLGALEKLIGELLQLGAGHGELDMLRPSGIGGDEGEVDVEGLAGGKGNLRFLSLLLDALEGVGLA